MKQDNPVVMPDVDVDREAILIGWDNIAKYLGCSKYKLMRNYKNEWASLGFYFIMRMGRPFRPYGCVIKEDLLNWIRIKAQKGEMI